MKDFNQLLLPLDTKQMVEPSEFIPSQHYPDPSDTNTVFRNIKQHPDQIHPTYYQVWKGMKEPVL